MHDSNYRIRASEDSIFELCMDKVLEIRLNRIKKHVVVILKTSIDREVLGMLYDVTMLGGCEVLCRKPNLG